MDQGIPENLDKNELSNIWRKFWKDWAVFASTIFSPLIAVLCIITFVLMWLRFKAPVGTNLPPVIDVAITFIISILSGLVGGLIAERWSKTAETSILVTRGKSAIRGLKLLLGNISGIEQRAAIYITEVDKYKTDINQSSMIALFGYEEIKRKSIELQEEALNAIEEWQDIIPEASNWKTQIGVISELKNERTILTKERSSLIDQLAQQSNTSEEQSKELLKRLEAKENELKTVNQKLKQKESQLSTSISTTRYTGLTGQSDIGLLKISPGKDLHASYLANPSISLFPKRCKHCGTEIPPTNGLTITGETVCPKCGKDPDNTYLTINP